MVIHKRINELNKIGANNDPQFEVIEVISGRDKNNKILTKIRNLKTGEIVDKSMNELLKKKNPFYQKINQELRVRELNNIGLQSKNPFFVTKLFFGKDKYKKTLTEVESLKTGERRVCRMSNLINGKDPFHSFFDDNERIIELNKIGASYKNSFIVDNLRYGKGKNGGCLTKIKNTMTKEFAICQLSHLLNGMNPFNENQERIELKKVQPIYEEIFKKYNVCYVKEYSLGKKRIDFMFEIKGTKYGLEVKQSEKWHSDKNQLETYRKLANLAQHKLERVFLSDPKGSHFSKGSISIHEFEKTLENLIQK